MSYSGVEAYETTTSYFLRHTRILEYLGTIALKTPPKRKKRAEDWSLRGQKRSAKYSLTHSRIIAPNVPSVALDDAAHGSDDEERTDERRRQRGASLHFQKIVAHSTCEWAVASLGERNESPESDDTDHGVATIDHTNQNDRREHCEHRNVRTQREVPAVRRLCCNRDVEHHGCTHPRKVQSDREFAADVLRPRHMGSDECRLGEEEVERQEREPHEHEVDGGHVHPAQPIEEHDPEHVDDAGRREACAQEGRIASRAVERMAREKCVRDHQERREHVDHEPDEERVAGGADGRIVREGHGLILGREHVLVGVREELQREERRVHVRQHIAVRKIGNGSNNNLLRPTACLADNKDKSDEGWKVTKKGTLLDVCSDVLDVPYTRFCQTVCGTFLGVLYAGTISPSLRAFSFALIHACMSTEKPNDMSLQREYSLGKSTSTGGASWSLRAAAARGLDRAIAAVATLGRGRDKLGRAVPAYNKQSTLNNRLNFIIFTIFDGDIRSLDIQANEHDAVDGRDDDHREHHARSERRSRLDADHLLAVGSLERVRILVGERDERPRADDADHGVLTVHDACEHKHKQRTKKREVRPDRQVAAGDLLERNGPAECGRRRDPRKVHAETELATDKLLPLERTDAALVVGEQVDREQHEPEQRNIERREVHVLVVEQQAPAGVRDAAQRKEHAEHVRLRRVGEERQRRMEDVNAQRHESEHVDEAPDGERVRRRRDERVVLELRAVALREADPREHEL